METPLPCPFCGGEVTPYCIKIDKRSISKIGGRYYIQCNNGSCEVNPSMDRPCCSEEEVIARWNKRKGK